MKRIVLTIVLIAALGLIATTAVGYKGGVNCGNCPKQSGMAEPVVAEIQNPYADSYAAIVKKLAAKQEEMRLAWGNDSTTVGEINRLREEMLELKKEYLVLNDRIQRESSDVQGEAYAGAYGVCAGPNSGCGKKRVRQEKRCGMQGAQGNCQGKDPARCGDCPKQ